VGLLTAARSARRGVVRHHAALTRWVGWDGDELNGFAEIQRTLAQQ
jgi:hypothetical protein